MSIEVILGPPGTGKTHSLISIVEDAVANGIDPKEIGYVSFTKAAANEARDRIRAILPELPRAHFRYFRTLHSMCFKQLGASRSAMLSDDSMADFIHYSGLDIRTRRWAHAGPEASLMLGRGSQRPTPDEQALFLINLSRNQGSSLKDLYDNGEIDEPYSFICNTAASLRDYKKVRSVMDYTDLLEQFIDRGRSPKLRLLCIDEAQDLSGLQWQVAEKLMLSAERTILAGDDDQAIYAWAGADVKRFQWYARNHPSRVLSQSYRVPLAVQAKALAITGRMKERVPKDWTARSEFGNIIYADPYDLDYTKGEWMVLARTAAPLMYLQKHLTVLSDNWRKECPDLRLSTIHGAKGAEADNVVIFTDLTKKTHSRRNEDDELRVLYVAVTRARNNLYLGLPRTQRSYDV